VRRALAVFATLAVGAVACRRPREAPGLPLSGRAALALPDAIDSFVASAPVTGAAFVRRTYARGATRVDVTLARAALGAGGFDGWVAMSRAFPQAELDAPVTDANGFYQCTEAPRASCDLLIQLRSGVHVELRGGGTSTRADVDTLARGLPLRALAVTP
jgi:hypothetical protein